MSADQNLVFWLGEGRDGGGGTSFVHVPYMGHR